jgi:D-3-phosphoglycerate dehydrogenase
MNGLQAERPSVVVKDTIHEDAAVMLEKAGWGVRIFDTKRFGNEKLVETADGAYAVMTRSEGVPDEVLEVPSVRAIGMTSIGTDKINIRLASAREIAIIAGTNQSAQSVAELSIAHNLSLRRHLPEQQAALDRHDFAKRNDGHTISGSNVAIVGYGRIGKEAASLYKAMGANVGVYDIDKTVQPEDGIVLYDDLMELLAWAETASVHVPDSDGKPVLGAKEMRALGAKGVVINLARAKSVDPQALIHAVNERIIDGAAVDVFENEPAAGAYFESPYTGIERIHETIHNGAGTVDAQRALAHHAVSGLIMLHRDGDTSLAVNQHSLRPVAKSV